MGHGKSAEFMEKHKLPGQVKVIDLSTDFRMKANDHSFVYGLPETNKADIINAKYIANPGCFATAIQLAFLPLPHKGCCPKCM
jgi:N-acetyl-gamma-glutamyl-phosphate reductase